jgi:hypothetical protein
MSWTYGRKRWSRMKPGCTVAPLSSSRPAATFALPLLLPVRCTITAPPPPRGPRPARTGACPPRPPAPGHLCARPRCPPLRGPPLAAALPHLRTRAPARSSTASPERRRCCAHGEGNRSRSPTQEDAGEGTPGRRLPRAAAPPRAPVPPSPTPPGPSCRSATSQARRRAAPAPARLRAAASSSPPPKPGTTRPRLRRRQPRRGREAGEKSLNRGAAGGEKERTPERGRIEKKEK